jgi:hypothetical protein
MTLQEKEECKTQAGTVRKVPEKVQSNEVIEALGPQRERKHLEGGASIYIYR